MGPHDPGEKRQEIQGERGKTQSSPAGGEHAERDARFLLRLYDRTTENE
jgi:hypothetical protein